MAVLDRRAVLTGATLRLTCSLALVTLLQGCGLLYDAVQLVYPVGADPLDVICQRQELQVGMAVEPFRPFVFPAIWTDEGARVTGLDVQLVSLLGAAFSERCGKPVTPVLHLVRYRDLFLLLNEGQLDLFISAVAANVPSPTLAGFAYSIPYFYNGGIGGITPRTEIIERIRANLRGQTESPAREGLIAHALAGLTIAVQELTAAHLYAEANLKMSRLVLCDSLPAAFEAAAMAGGPPIDVILGAQPVLDYMVTHVQKDWRLLTLETGKPLLLTRGHYAVVMAEESYHLRWFVNNVIFKLDESGKLADMRKRWLEEQYAFPRRAALEGLPFDIEKMVAHYDQGACREPRGR